MPAYEAMFIFRPGLSEEEQKTVVVNLEEILKENQAQIASSEVFGKRQLAYEIKKCREGLYYLIGFSSASAGVVGQLKQVCNLNEKVLRVLVVKKRTPTT